MGFFKVTQPFQNPKKHLISGFTRPITYFNPFCTPRKKWITRRKIYKKSSTKQVRRKRFELKLFYIKKEPKKNVFFFSGKHKSFDMIILKKVCIIVNGGVDFLFKICMYFHRWLLFFFLEIFFWRFIIFKTLENTHSALKKGYQFWIFWSYTKNYNKGPSGTF